MKIRNGFVITLMFACIYFKDGTHMEFTGKNLEFSYSAAGKQTLLYDNISSAWDINMEKIATFGTDNVKVAVLDKCSLDRIK